MLNRSSNLNKPLNSVITYTLCQAQLIMENYSIKILKRELETLMISKSGLEKQKEKRIYNMKSSS